MTAVSAPAWQAFAACRDTDPDLFFPAAAPGTPAYAAQAAEAIAVCSACPVRAQCLDQALSNREQGVWGGLAEDQRTPAARRAAARAGMCRKGRHAKTGPGRCPACSRESQRKRNDGRERDYAAVYARRVTLRREREGLAA